ncbi:hypothetical protein [Nostocoides japonicum]|uniref:hypothetical protein n=1 Tax=Nostocoides japonicum TaxID=99481 RepID=UPI00065BAC98|nr:hypothetical protein [Tetrasphaera japonica]
MKDHDTTLHVHPSSIRSASRGRREDDDLDRLNSAAEDLADLEAARTARAGIEAGEAPIPGEQVTAGLGLA